MPSQLDIHLTPGGDLYARVASSPLSQPSAWYDAGLLPHNLPLHWVRHGELPPDHIEGVVPSSATHVATITEDGRRVLLGGLGSSPDVYAALGLTVEVPVRFYTGPGTPPTPSGEYPLSDLARFVGVGKPQMSRWLSGDNVPPPTRELRGVPLWSWEVIEAWILDHVHGPQDQLAKGIREKATQSRIEKATAALQDDDPDLALQILQSQGAIVDD